MFVFALILRLTEIYIIVVSMADGITHFWHGKKTGLIPVAEAVKWVCAAFALVAFLELIANPRNTGCRASFAFSLVLMLYGFGLAYFTSDIARLLYYYLGRSPSIVD